MNEAPSRPASARSGRRTTLRAVADMAGVSIATASKVVNGRSDVASETRILVERAIESLGYVSQGERQQSLQAAGESSVELVVEPKDASLNPYLAMFLGGALEAAEELRVALIVRPFGTASARAPVEWARDLARAGRSGVIEVTSAYSADRERALGRAGLPMVLVDPLDVPRTNTPSIGATNWAGAYEATRHLIELGHRDIRYIGGPAGAHCSVVRGHGWAAAMAEAGLTADVSDLSPGGFTFEHGLEAATAMLTAPQPPTAIFVGSDASAMGVLEAARVLGLSVPADLSVVGFDDTILARSSNPQLTTVHQPIAAIGRTAVATIVRLSRGETAPTKRVELATHLVIRNSTAAPPAHRRR